MIKKILGMIFGKICFIFFVFWQIKNKNKIHPSCNVYNIRNLKIGINNTVKGGVYSLSNGVLHFGDDCWVNHGVEICPDKKIYIGNGSSIQKRTTINGNVKIGEYCIIAPNVFISSGTHVFNLFPKMTIREQERYAAEHKMEHYYDKPVNIGNDVWIGTNAVIMPGVTIEDHCIIGANAVVTKDISSGLIVAGVPATPIGQRCI